MNAFDDVRLPVDVEVGAEGGPAFSTGITIMANGREQRTQNWSVARNRYTIGYGTSERDWPAVQAFFYARRGRARGFRFKDWLDYTAEYEPVQLDAQGNMLLSRTYSDDLGISYIRQITRVVPGTLHVYDVNKVELSGYSESYGLLNGPQRSGLYASFEFDLPVRFDVDELSLTAETVKAATVDGITIIELIEDSLKLNGR